MNCPVCGQDCLQSSDDLLNDSFHRFDACPSCQGLPRDKRVAPVPDDPPLPCSRCGRRYIDDVFFHIWLILVDERVLPPSVPLSAAGVPHLHPFMVLDAPPYLPLRSMILLTHEIDRQVACRLMDEVPELRGVVRDRHVVPGLSQSIDSGVYHTHELVAGCDLRATIFPSPAGNVVVYQQSSTMHIEMPRPFNPKLASVARMIERKHPDMVIDGCCGVGTLGIAAALSGMAHVVLNDRWYAAAFWTAVNISVNRRPLGVDEFVWSMDFADLSSKKIRRCPVAVASASGQGTELEVWHGDFRCLPRKFANLSGSLCVFDPFEKEDRRGMEKVMFNWKNETGGQIFIP